MKSKLLRVSLFGLLVILISAGSCWAKTDGYLYVVGYSFFEKKAFFSGVIVQKVRDVSYSSEEYVTEIELVRKMESRFKSFLTNSMRLDASKYTISVRGAYKSQAVAGNKLAEEQNQLTQKGFTVSAAAGFIYLE